MIWVSVLIAALIAVPVSTKIHDDNIALAQAEQEMTEMATVSEKANTDVQCEPTTDN